MKNKQQLEEIEAIVNLYLIHNEGNLDKDTEFALNVTAEFMCYLNDHNCKSAKDAEERFNLMKTELEEDGIIIQDAIDHVKQRERGKSLAEQAKLN